MCGFAGGRGVQRGRWMWGGGVGIFTGGITSGIHSGCRSIDCSSTLCGPVGIVSCFRAIISM